jgi:deoxyribose-phosphate aldolase
MNDEKNVLTEQAEQKDAFDPAGGAINVCDRIDHTALKPVATEEDIVKLCREAVEYGFASVCVNTFYLPLCRKLLKEKDETGVNCCVVIGFPLGACATEAKIFETLYAVREGADEIDMVINVGAIKAGQDEVAAGDIRGVREACRGKILKVIIETGLLTDEEKVRATTVAALSGADFVKTCTGFSAGAATTADVSLIRATLDSLESAGSTPHVKIKASGGIRTYEDALSMIFAGADRLGASAGVKIAQEQAQQNGGQVPV